MELDLSANRLYKIPSSTFQSVPNLHSLSLRDNMLRVVPTGAFTPLSQLVKLDLRNSQIKHLNVGSFSGLDRLERLYLASNLLRGVEGVEEVLPVIHELTLEDNPWQCDCHAKTLRLWLEHTALPSLSGLTCAGPARLAGSLIRLVPLSSLACSPLLSPATVVLSVGEGRQVSLTCNVEADPLAVVSWTFEDSELDQVGEAEISVKQQIIDRGVIRSILTIPSASSAWNGTFHCRAENMAGTRAANYSLHVEKTRQRGRILDLKLEYFILLTAGVLAIFVISVLFIILVLALIARRTIIKSQNSPAKNNKIEMPRKSEQFSSVGVVYEYRAPDIISDVSHSLYQTRNTSHSSCFSLETTTTPASLTSSTNAILQPSVPMVPPSSSLHHVTHLPPPLSRGWRSSEHFLSFQFPVHQNNWNRDFTTTADKYPPDFGLPRISLSQSTNPSNLSLTRKYLSEKEQSQMWERKQSEVWSAVPGDHEYSQIASLTLTGCEHHYESLPSLINPPLSTSILDNNGAQQNFSEITGKSFTSTKKFLSLPVLDLDYVDDNCPGESEI